LVELPRVPNDIPELLAKQKSPIFSFEFFLPKAPEDIDAFIANVKELKKLDPAFVTLTYGAGGSARDRTIEAAIRLQKEVGLPTASHLTAITHTKAEISAILDRLEKGGIKHIVALRGDVPQDGSAKPVEQREFAYARDLVSFIKKRGGFKLAVAAYPETHPEAGSVDADTLHLASKAAAGADWVISQLFFDNKDYFSLVDRARKAGVNLPIVPGIMPVTGYAQLKRFTALCGSKLPAELVDRLEQIHDDPEAVIAYGIEYAAKQCRELLEKGAPGIHFYTLNRSRSTSEILARLRKA
jgi:methylenetetrahydrofolate reductase (NADPH)